MALVMVGQDKGGGGGGGKRKRRERYGRFEMGFIGCDDLKGREKIDRIYKRKKG
jgi:hypothetical protein